MPSIQEIVRQEINPFDATTFRPGNFWQEEQDGSQAIASIHAETIEQVQEIVGQVARDRRTRTILLAGDSGAGKSYFLGRLKRLLNPTAFFAYIGPWPDSNYVWRHTLRNTVDSLTYVPEGQERSQLLLWLASLSAFKQSNAIENLLGQRHVFINNFKVSYPVGIYNANEFFGVLYALTQPKTYPLACEWLRGDDLDEESLKKLHVRRPIETEDAAQKVLANFGKIASAKYPLVLCFDNLDNIDRSDGAIDLQALFNLNSSLHNQKLKNFLVIISIITNTWKLNSKRIQPADKARIDIWAHLKPIGLDQAEALWEKHLSPLHCLAHPQPESTIYPLSRQNLEEKFPGGKTLPRYALMLGRQLLQNFKDGGLATETTRNDSEENELLAAFQLAWLKVFDRTCQQVTRVRHFSAPELIQMLREVLETFQVEDVRSRLLPSTTYASYSLSYPEIDSSPFSQAKPRQRIGIVWTEDPSMTNFYHIMRACQKALEKELCKSLFLIRNEGLGKTSNKGYKIYKRIFDGARHLHIIPDALSDVRYLATYHKFVTAAIAGDFVLLDRNLTLQDLEVLVRRSEILHECALLQHLGILQRPREKVAPVAIAQEPPSKRETEKRPIDASKTNAESITPETDAISEEAKEKLTQQVREFLLSLMETQKIMGRGVLVENAIAQFEKADTDLANQLIEGLRSENRLFVPDDRAPWEEQLICLVQ